MRGSRREIVLNRVLAAPRERVWSAWTEREHVDRWWGPDGFTNATIEMEVRPGGVWRYTMRGPDGTVYPNRVRYRVVERPDRLEYGHDDGAGEHAFQVTVTLREEGEGTRVTMRVRFPPPKGATPPPPSARWSWASRRWNGWRRTWRRRERAARRTGRSPFVVRIEPDRPGGLPPRGPAPTRTPGRARCAS